VVARPVVEPLEPVEVEEQVRGPLDPAPAALGRLRDAYGNGPRGFHFIPALEVSDRTGMRALEQYAGAASFTGLALLQLNWLLDAMPSGGDPAGLLASDMQRGAELSRGQSTFATVRHGDSWYAVKQGRSLRREPGDLRYDAGLAIAKRRGDDGAWTDVVPARPKTRTPSFDSSGPDIVSGAAVVGAPVGADATTSRGRVRVTGSIGDRHGRALAPYRASYATTACGVALRFAVRPGLVYEYSAFFRGTKSPKRDGGTLTGADQVVTADPAPETVHIKKSYGSANDPRLVRARMRFRVSKARDVRVEMC
jgi:hypothetical protein